MVIEEIMIVGGTMTVCTVHECDRQTDGQPDRFTMTKTALCIASRGKKWRKMHVPSRNILPGTKV